MQSPQTIFLHFRLCGRHGHLLGNGRVTLCFIPLPSGLLSCGVAVCSPQDRFSRRIGRLISEGRVRKRKGGWDKYFRRAIRKEQAGDQNAIRAFATEVARKWMERLCDRLEIRFHGLYVGSV